MEISLSWIDNRTMSINLFGVQRGVIPEHEVVCGVCMSKLSVSQSGNEYLCGRCRRSYGAEDLAF